MTDYTTLKDIFEMAEVLEDFGESSLELKIVNADDNKCITVIFGFNEQEELLGAIYTGD